MRWRLAVASPRTRCGFSAGWGFLWCLGYASVTLIPLGARGYRWWLPIVGFSLLVGLSTGALTAWMERGVAASYAAAPDGLSADQRRQVAKVWRRGPVPTDPAVLIAVLRLHGLLDRYRQASRSRRVAGAVLVGIATVMRVAASVADRHAVSQSAVMFLLLGVLMVAAPTATALRSRRQQPRLAELRAAAQADPVVAAAVAQPGGGGTPDPGAASAVDRCSCRPGGGVRRGAPSRHDAQPPPYRVPSGQRCRVGDLPRPRFAVRRRCARTGRPAVVEVSGLVGLVAAQGSEADSDPETALYLHRIAVLGAQIVGGVERVRRPGQADPATTLAGNQRADVALIDALVAEEGYALDQCRGVA